MVPPVAYAGRPPVLLSHATKAAPPLAMALAVTTPSLLDTSAVGMPLASTPRMESEVPEPGPQNTPLRVRPAMPLLTTPPVRRFWRVSPQDLRVDTPGMVTGPILSGSLARSPPTIWIGALRTSTTPLNAFRMASPTLAAMVPRDSMPLPMLSRIGRMKFQTVEMAFLIPSHAGIMTLFQSQLTMSPTAWIAALNPVKMGEMTPDQTPEITEPIPLNAGEITLFQSHMTTSPARLMADFQNWK